jgi:hypothetical protein
MKESLDCLVAPHRRGEADHKLPRCFLYNIQFVGDSPLRLPPPPANLRFQVSKGGPSARSLCSLAMMQYQLRPASPASSSTAT